MRKILENIRKKTPEQKIRIIWIVVVISVLFLTVLWTVTWKYKKLSFNDSSKASPTCKAGDEQSSSRECTPKDTFDTLIKGLHNTGEGLKPKK